MSAATRTLFRAACKGGDGGRKKVGITEAT